MIATQNGSMTKDLDGSHQPSRRQGKERTESNKTVNTTKISPRPTIANYKRILSVMRKTSGLWERVDKRMVGVFTPNRRVFDFPHDVVAVTEALHKQGLNLRTIAACGIRQAAIRIVVKDAAPATIIWKRSNRVISFRIPEQSANVLDEMMNARRIVGIRSRNQFVRRLALDFTAQRLVYPDSGTPIVDWEKLQVRTASVVKAALLCALPTKPPSPRSSASFLTDDDLTGDIERVISKVVTPYVDPSNPMLHFDELQAECRAKLAKIIHAGRLAQCPTRGKVFAFVKTSFRNHVRSIVEKYAFAAKRTGVAPPPRLPIGEGYIAARTKVQVIRLDDPDIGHQLGHDDHRFLQGEFIEELFAQLSPSECVELNALIRESSLQSPESEKGFDLRKRQARAERKARVKLLRRCREILIG